MTEEKWEKEKHNIEKHIIYELLFQRAERLLGSGIKRSWVPG